MLVAAGLRAEATEILDGGLGDVLRSYGDVVVHGSYALDLMVWRDLDIYLVAPDIELSLFFELGGRLATLLDAHRMHFRNERAAANSDLPAGLYWGMYLKEWKIDIWNVSEAEAARLLAYQESVARELTPEARRIILEIKAAMYRDARYRKEFGAKHIYDAVLHGGVTDVEGFAAHIGLR
jgi:hypothetical protein